MPIAKFPDLERINRILGTLWKTFPMIVDLNHWKQPNEVYTTKSPLAFVQYGCSEKNEIKITLPLLEMLNLRFVLF